jgi:hypothetical protein
MAMGSFRPAPFLLSLSVGVVIAFLVHASGPPPPPPVAKGILAIVVGPKACQLNYPKVQISKVDGEVAIWVARRKTDKLRIEFENEVFEGMMRQANGRWVPAGCGTSRVCYSGNIKDTTTPSPTVEYKYWQILIDTAGKEDPCDGHMIINP